MTLACCCNISWIAGLRFFHLTSFVCSLQCLHALSGKGHMTTGAVTKWILHNLASGFLMWLWWNLLLSLCYFCRLTPSVELEVRLLAGHDEARIYSLEHFAFIIICSIWVCCLQCWDVFVHLLNSITRAPPAGCSAMVSGSSDFWVDQTITGHGTSSGPAFSVLFFY